MLHAKIREGFGMNEIGVEKRIYYEQQENKIFYYI
jgi:hypothetical protein